MGLLGLFKKRPPDLRTLGKWLWNNDVTLLDQTLQNATVALFAELVQSDIIRSASGLTTLNQDQTDLIAGHLTNLLDGRYLLKSYEPKTHDTRLLSAAEATRDLVLRGEYPKLKALALMTASLFAIRAWYANAFTESIAISSHVISIANEKGAAEAYRVRGFAQFALGNHEAALADMLDAQRRQPGLVGINEPIRALRKLTDTSASGDIPQDPAALEMDRLALKSFSSILRLGATAVGAATAPNELYDFGGMANLADKLLKSKSLERRKARLGSAIDLAKCALSAKLALSEYLLPKGRPGRSSLPSEQEIRDAFGWCMFFLHGTTAINPSIDPSFASAVRDLQREVEALFASLDQAKFDLT